MRWLDLAILAALLAVAAQLLPVPPAILDRIDPHAVPLRAALSLTAASSSQLPLSISPGDTVSALGIFAAAALLFWTCRQICEAGGGAGRIIRAAAFIGLLASLAAIVLHGQRGPANELLYGIWRPRDAGARPFGPFVNRNHFATWLMMACPLVFGYLLARAPAVPEKQRMAQRIVRAAKQLGSVRVWLATAVCLMTLAVVISASRSGIIGLAAAFVASMLLSRAHSGSQTRGWTIFQIALLVVVVLSFANFNALSARVDETLADAQSDSSRRAIWRDAERVIRDFPLTGTGAGTFGSAVGPYQTSVPGFSIGNAHNQYLQVAAEGGALLAVPCILALVSFLTLFRHRLTQDRDSTFLVRAGAGAGIVAVLVQSIWETGLRMPANAMLFAVLAAIAIHTPPLTSTPAHHHHSR
jgi:O-antigen ligase